MKRESPGWLKRTQESSWEPEILISGISLLVLFQLPVFIHRAQVYVNDNTFAIFQFGSVDNTFFTLMETAVYWLIICLIAHLGLRSIWVSFVGLSYAFPEGISFKSLKLTDFFKSRLIGIRSFEDSVIRLEKISSMAYATAFLLVLATIGVSLYFSFWVVLIASVYPLLPKLIGGTSINLIIFIVMLIFAIPYFIDFITLGWLKRFKLFSKIYRPIYIVSGILTLAPFYRGIYYGLISNIRRRYIFAGTFGFLIVTVIIISGLRGQSIIDRSTMVDDAIGYSVLEGYYRDLNPLNPNSWASIESSEVDNGVIQLIISHKAAYEKIIKANCGYESRIAKDDESKSLILLDCLSNFVEIEIDSTSVKPERWFFANSPRSNQKGLATWLRTDTITNGVHQLNVFIHQEDTLRKLVASIPFFNLSGKSFSKSRTIELPEAIEAQKNDSVPGINLPLKRDL